MNFERTLSAVGRSVDEFLERRSPRARKFLGVGAAGVGILLVVVIWMKWPSATERRDGGDAARLRLLAEKRDASRPQFAPPEPVRSGRAAR
jgi:type II secretory pathway component PulM